jgi:hypothetical protein
LIGGAIAGQTTLSITIQSEIDPKMDLGPKAIWVFRSIKVTKMITLT